MNPALFRPVANQPHAIPGTFAFIGEQRQDKTTFQLLVYDKDASHWSQPITFLDCVEAMKQLDDQQVKWLNVSGLHDIDLMKQVAQHFGLHPMLMEDVLNTTQRPQLREMEDGVFAQFRMIRMDDTRTIETELISIFLIDRLLITFQEYDGDVFDGVRSRIEKAHGRIRRKSTDYLMFSLVDALCDNYLRVLEHFGEEIELLETDVIESSDSNVLHRINEKKSELVHFRGYTRPTRDAIERWRNLDADCIEDGTEYYLDALSNLVGRIHQQTDDYRSILSDQLSIYHSNLSSKLNDIMKVLTIYSVIFIPLTFIAGIYGTNFEYIPELKVRNGYFYMWGAMGLVTVALLFLFRRKKWL